MKRVISVFFSAREAHPIAVLLCLLVASVTEAIGVGSLLPAVTMLAGGDTSRSSGLNRMVRETVNSLGITPDFANLIVFATLLLVAKALLLMAALSYVSTSATNVSNSLRRRLVAALFDARWSFFADQSTGRFANAISNDAGRAADAYLTGAQVLVLLIKSVAYAIIALVLDWRLASIGLVASMTIALLMGRLVRITRRAGYKQTDRTSALIIAMVDMLTNIKPLKSMQRYDAMLTDIAMKLKRLKRSLARREVTKVIMQQGNDAMIVVLVGIVAWFAYAVWSIPLPELLVSGLVFFQIVATMSALQKSLQQFAGHESAYVRTQELVAHAEGQREDNPGRGVPAVGDGCRFDRVSFSHDRTPVIKAASFEIPANAITLFSGPSGAGKTTIIDLLIGLNRPDAGTITVGGVPLAELDMRAWRRMIGYVPQELSLFHSSIRDNITLADSAIADAAVLEALDLAGAAGFLATLPDGLDTNVGEMGTKFSGGQRQRISLARALVTRPQVLILDEVTSALDPATEAEIVANIAALRGRFTIIAITHRPAWTEIADRLYRVSGGRVSQEKPERPAKPKSGASPQPLP
ncbi:MAG: ABC transporter ATP-binding protein [Rhizobiales bacterium]|nr:ABC transporter ATP-binding protein [Hyphomicrobiales bacterium]